MVAKEVAEEDREAFRRLKEVRAAALEHYLKAQEFSAQRAALIRELVATGYSQSDIAREMGVSRQPSARCWLSRRLGRDMQAIVVGTAFGDACTFRPCGRRARRGGSGRT